jgi:hypothetical protein
MSIGLVDPIAEGPVLSASVKFLGKKEEKKNSQIKLLLKSE